MFTVAKDNFSYFSMKKNVVTPHQTVSGDGSNDGSPNICFKGVTCKIIPKLSLLPLFIWSTDSGVIILTINIPHNPYFLTCWHRNNNFFSHNYFSFSFALETFISNRNPSPMASSTGCTHHKWTRIYCFLKKEKAPMYFFGSKIGGFPSPKYPIMIHLTRWLQIFGNVLVLQPNCTRPFKK